MPLVDGNVGDVELKESFEAQRKPLFLGKRKRTLQSLSSKNHSNLGNGSIRENKKSWIQNEATRKSSDSIPGNNLEWNVLYTTQITKKSKSYHDGILRLVCCGSNMNQVILLNEDGTVLSSKYLKSVECVETGRDFAFPNYLVQICEARTHSADNLSLGSSEEVADCRSSRRNKLMSNHKITDIQNKHSKRVDRGVPNDARFTNNDTKSIYEWNALYTTQKTQKAKRYHDGILRLVNCGSHMKQVILLNEGEVLDSKYLKQTDFVETGNTYEFPNYLVEVCESKAPVGDIQNERPEKAANCIGSDNDRLSNLNDKQIPNDDIPEGPLDKVACHKSTSRVKFAETRNDCNYKTILKDVQKGHSEKLTLDGGRSTSLSDRPLRDVSQILSFLKKPIQTPQSLNVIALDEDGKDKVQEVNVWKQSTDHHKGNTVVIHNGCHGKIPSQEYSILSNRLSGNVAPEMSPIELEVDYTGVNNGTLASEVSDSYSMRRPVDNTDKVPSSSISSQEENISADENKCLTDEIKELQAEWTILSRRVSTIGYVKSPVSMAQNNAHAGKKCELDYPLGETQPVCGRAEMGSTNSELQITSRPCLEADMCPTFDLGFE